MSMIVAEWIDLLDPDEKDLRQAWTDDLHPQAVDDLLEPTVHDDEPRPKLESHGGYVLGVLLVPVVVAAEDRVYYQEVDLVLAPDLVLSVRKTPDNGVPLDLASVKAACREGLPAGMLAYHIMEQIAEGFLDLVDDVQAEIDELEDHIEDWPNERVRRRLSDLRPHDIELHFGDAYDKLMRASEGLDAARDLLAGVRDYHQSKVANDQNEVMKRLTAIASILLVPTFIVGLYGQNFRDIPELRWHLGYAWSWGLIVAST